MIFTNSNLFRSAALLLCAAAALSVPAQEPVDSLPPVTNVTVDGKAGTRNEEKTVKKILFIGDSMTGWLAERLNAYGRKNGFEVATVVWDGSTIQKWANSPKLRSLISSQDPDAVFVCLGLNELFEPKPAVRFKSAVDKIVSAVGDRGLVWVGPPSWPGRSEGKVLNDWLEQTLGETRFFRSSDLDLGRQSKSNPHPSRDGIVTWVGSLVEWLPGSEVKFKSLDEPDGPQMSRGKTFIYKRMKETL